MKLVRALQLIGACDPAVKWVRNWIKKNKPKDIREVFDALKAKEAAQTPWERDHWIYWLCNSLSLYHGGRRYKSIDKALYTKAVGIKKSGFVPGARVRVHPRWRSEAAFGVIERRTLVHCLIRFSEHDCSWYEPNAMVLVKPDDTALQS